MQNCCIFLYLLATFAHFSCKWNGSLLTMGATPTGESKAVEYTGLFFNACISPKISQRSYSFAESLAPSLGKDCSFVRTEWYTLSTAPYLSSRRSQIDANPAVGSLALSFSTNCRPFWLRAQPHNQQVHFFSWGNTKFFCNIFKGAFPWMEVLTFVIKVCKPRKNQFFS